MTDCFKVEFLFYRLPLKLIRGNRLYFVVIKIYFTKLCHIKNPRFCKVINICNGLEKKTIKGDKFLTKNRHGRLRTADSLHVKQVLYP